VGATSPLTTGRILRQSRPTLRPDGRWNRLGHEVALAGALAVALLTSGSDHWRLAQLGLIALLAISSEMTAVATGSDLLQISGSFLGIMLAAVLLGGGPAALVGVLTIAIGWLRTREPGHYLRNNLATYAWFPLISGLAFHVVVTAVHLHPRAGAYYLLVFGAFAFALALNFAGIAGYQAGLDGTRLSDKAREALTPILASELFSVLLTLGTVYFVITAGTIGLALCALVLVIFQYLLGALLLSKRRSEDLERMATIDELTGLPNREHFRTGLRELIDRHDGGTEEFSVMIMDLDRFKEINDTLGHHYGDLLLRELGPRLVSAAGPDGLVARLGGDEFAILSARSSDDPTAVERLSARLLDCVQQPLEIDDLSLEVGASIGVSRFPRDGHSAHDLLRCADVAMYAAKETLSGFAVYAPDQDRHSLGRLNIVSDVRRAIEAGEVVVHYQPKVDPTDLKVRGAEALVRWQHPDYGLLQPGSFIPAVEQSGLIGPLTRHVLDKSIEQCAAWRDAGHDLTVAVNLSVRNLLDRELPPEIERMLAEHQLPAHALELELTERIIMSDPDRALAILTRLSDLGVKLSVDDFGTGYSSLANLRRFPIDELKIDRSFVTPMLHDEGNMIIVRSTINLAHDLGLRAIAEGVEDGPTLESLSRFGCDLAQGYHLSRPLASEAFDEWLGGDPPTPEPALV
jgi:diguanylate cyclase (GGDEF)-like protein